MASQRRGRSRTPELRGTLGTLLRTAAAQAGVVREALASGARAALERGAAEGRSRLVEVRAERRRDEALAELGAAVLELIRAGEIDLEELPEVRELVDEIEAIDDDVRMGRGRARSPAADFDDDDREPRLPSSRSRFDDRDASRGARGSDGTVAATGAPPRRSAVNTSVWRPVAEAAPRGGITFDDEDLADYMQPDDVPAKGEDPPKDPRNES